MIELIPVIKSDRNREINELEHVGYQFRSGKNKYIHVARISVTACEENSIGEKYWFEVRADQSDQRFFVVVLKENESGLNVENGCMYLSIYEIYEILHKMAVDTSQEKIIDVLNSERTKVLNVEYGEVNYSLKYFSHPLEKLQVEIPGTNIFVSHENIMVLLALIQDKSNYYWSSSSEENRMLYTDGIIRLFSCLITTKGHEILENKGWIYDGSDGVFSLVKPLVQEAKRKKIYYLTKEEYKNIMEARNPRNFVKDGGL